MIKVGDRAQVILIDDRYYGRVGLVTVKLWTGKCILYFSDTTTREYDEKEVQKI